MTISPERKAMLRQLADLHDSFVDEQLAGAEFRPGGRPAKSDYNQHYVDLEADTDAFHEQARQIFGI